MKCNCPYFYKSIMKKHTFYIFVFYNTFYALFYIQFEISVIRKMTVLPTINSQFKHNGMHFKITRYFFL